MRRHQPQRNIKPKVFKHQHSHENISEEGRTRGNPQTKITDRADHPRQHDIQSEKKQRSEKRNIKLREKDDRDEQQGPTVQVKN